MDAVADLADRYSFGELRVTHEQNLLLPDVRQSDLYAVWQEAQALGLATANIGMITNIIACPGGDYCSLANAKSIPVAEAIQRRFDDLDYVYDIGELDLNISGCMNSCGHHHIGHIGILGVDKQGAEFYQISIGGAQGNDASLGKVLGPFGVAGRSPRRRREADRGLSRAPRQRRRTLHRRRAPHRHRTFQGTRLWRSSRIESSQPTAGSCLKPGAEGALPSVPATGDVIVPLAVWRAQRAALLAREGGLGVWLAGDARSGRHRARTSRTSR